MLLDRETLLHLPPGVDLTMPLRGRVKLGIGILNTVYKYRLIIEI